jgi:ferric-dicitrate binding protein FerR (iron transport regulator)
VKEASDHIDNLLGKYLAGEASSSERDEVEAWIVASPENQRYFNDLKFISERAGKIQNWQPFDTDAAWTRMKSRVAPQEPKTIHIPKKSEFRIIWSIAASLVLVMAVAYILYTSTRKPVQTLALHAVHTTVEDTLPDKSVAFLNKGTTLDYEYNPREKVRKLKLKGEAFFDVKHKEQQPFIIESDDVIIEDIGTTFNVKAYPGNPTVEVFVESGEVAFYTKENPGIHLLAGETGIYNKESKSFAKLVESDTNILSYKTRVFNFYNSDLGTVVESLNEVYETKIQLRGNLKSCRLNVTFKNEPIESIAEIIAETLNLKITFSEKEILLEGSGCE